MKAFNFLIITGIYNLFASNASAQQVNQFGFQLGLNVGTVKYVPELNHTGSITTGYQTGIAAGLTSSLPFSRHWALAPGLRYIHTGFTTDEVVPTTNSTSQSYTAYKNTYDLNRIELPVDMFYFFDQAQKGIFIVGGVSAGVLLGGKRTVDVSYTDGVRTAGYSIKDDIKVAKDYSVGVTSYHLQRWDAGIKGGLGYRYRNVSAQAFYRFGIANIATNSALNFPSPSTYSRLAELQLAYLFSK